MKLKSIHIIFLLCVATFYACSPKANPGTSKAERAPGSIKFMSYNVHHCNPPSKPGFIDVAAIAGVIKREAPDVVALQEIDVNTARSGKINEIAELSKKTGYHAFHFSKAIDHDGGDYGTAILSKYPLSDAETHKLPTDPATGGEPRVLGLATVTLPGNKKIRIANVHLDFKGNTNGKLQMTEVNRILSGEKLPVIIGGDFNAVEGSVTINLLDNAFTRTCKNCPFTIPVIKPNKTIDFIAYKPASAFSVINHRVIAETYASDHLPVLAELKLGF